MADQPLAVVKSEPLTVVASAPPPQGTWEDRGMAGMVWHPPGVPAGRDLTSQRADSAIAGGVPVIGSINPEDALIAYAGGRGVASAMQGQIGAAARTLAGMRATLSTAAPAIKYQVTKSVLESVGVPPVVATALATGVSMRRGGAAAAEAAAAESLPGYPRAGTTPPAPADPVAPHLDRTVPVAASALTREQLAERLQFGTGTPGTRPPVYAPRPMPTVVEPPITPVVAPPAAPPAAPAPPAAVAPPTVAPISPVASSPSAAWSPQRIRNEVGLAARRAKVTLSDAQAQAAEALVETGQDPAAAVFQSRRMSAPTEGPATPAPPPKATMSAAEMRTYTDLRSGGTSHQEAVDLLQAQRDLAARLGTPTSEAVRQAVAERNASGRWPSGTPGE